MYVTCNIQGQPETGKTTLLGYLKPNVYATCT